jgi:hypothetical protein
LGFLPTDESWQIFIFLGWPPVAGDLLSLKQEMTAEQKRERLRVW